MNYKGKTYVLYKTHHIINDAWGVLQIGEQINELYSIIDKPKKLKNFQKYSYINFIQKEDEYKLSNKFEKDKEFWKEYIKNFSTEKRFNRDISKIDANRIKKKLNLNISLKIKEYCFKNKISEYSFFLAIVAIYYYKIFNIKNLNIATPFLNRSIEQFNSIGLFVTNLPLNIKINSDINFLELCNNISIDSMKIFRRSKFPYIEIQKLYNEMNMNSNLFEVGYSYQVNRIEEEKKGKLGQPIWYFQNAQNNPITIHIYPMEEDIQIFYDYLIDVFKEEEIEKQHKIFIHILNQVINNRENKSIKIKNINVIIEEERKKIIKFNNTGNINFQETTISKKIDKIIKKHSRKIALKFKDQVITYSELGKKINSLAYELRKSGVRRNVPIALFFDKSIEMIISMFAIIKAGGCYIPILPEENKERIKYIIDDCNPMYILTSDKYSENLSFKNIIIVNYKKIEDIKKNLEDINSPNDLLCVIYTSGSTGNPKGTKIMHKNVYGFLKSMQDNKDFKLTDNDVSMSLLKYSFDASGIDIYSSLLTGGRLILISKEDELDPYKIVKIMEKEKVTRSFLVPKWLEKINMVDKELEAKLSKLKVLGTGGEVFKPRIVENLFFKYPKLNIINLYGPTEATMFCTYCIVKEKNIKENNINIGKPIKYSRAYIVNDENEFMPTNIEGELILVEDSKSIKNLADGYLNLNNITDLKFIKLQNILDNNKEVRVYKTGDIAKINNNLELEFIGRNDDIIKMNNGYLVSINEVETVISKILKGKFQINIIPININNTKTLVLFIEGNKKKLKPNELKQKINSSLSFYMRVKNVFIISKFPLNNSGKIDKKELYKIAEKNIIERKIIIPENETQERIYQIIKKQCDLGMFSILDDFIDDLNIDSLDLGVIYSLINNKNLKLQDLYTYTTVKTLGDFIDNNKNLKVEKDFKKQEIKNDVKKFDITNIFITGVTGFLGIHLLWELLNNDKVKKIYCLVRRIEDKSSYERLMERLNYYFDLNSKNLALIKNKVEILEGDINKKKLGLDEKKYQYLKKTCTTFINSAANVNHYGKYEHLYKTNVESLKNILNFCGNKISLAHISTLSIAGFKSEKTEDIIFNENSIYIKQTFNDNPYLITKYQAEVLLLKNNVNVKIFRLGNIMPRIEDGKFQPNYKQNAFINSMRLILRLNKISKEYLDVEIEFSPVEECSKSICKLIELDSSKKIYHIINNNTIKMKDLVNMFFEDEMIKIVDKKEFIENLNNYDEIGAEYIKEYILQNNINKYSIDETLKMLEITNFKWSKINKQYLNNIRKIINDGEW